MDEPRSNIETAQPLLSDQNEVEAAWDEDVENSRPDASENDVSVEGLMGKPSHNVLKFLQTSGVQKIAEFTAPDDVVFGAFGDTPILTFGAESKFIDAEREWNDRMCLLVNKKSHQSKSKSVPKAFTNQVAVEAYVVPIQGAAGSGPEGIIQPLLRLWQAKRCSFAVFSLPAIQSVIFFKWETFARKLLIAELAVYCLWVFAFYAFTAALQDEDLSLSLSELLQSSRGRFTVGSEIVALVAMTPFLLLEAGTIIAYGWAWVRDPSNSLDLATYALQTVITIQHLGRVWLQSSWLTYCLALQCILLTFRLQYFTQVLRPMRFSFTNVVREVLAEVRWMLLFIFVTCTGFGAAMHITFRKEEKPPEEFESFPRSVLAAFEHLYGDLQLKYFVHSQYPVFGSFLAIAFIVIMSYVLINMLIGVIVNSLHRTLEHEGAKQLCNQARVIDEIESLLPSFFERRHAEWHPLYVHVLRINPNKLDSIELDKLWSRHGEFAPVMLRRNDRDDDDEDKDKKKGQGNNKAGGGVIQNRSLENKLQEILDKINRLEERLTVEAGKEQI